MKKTLTILAAVFIASSVFAQTSSNTSGGEASGSGGSSSYSVGQIVYTTSDGTSGSVAQGVQHAYEIYSVGIKETRLDISLTAFPNPTADYLTLQISVYAQEKLSYQLYDLQGKLLTQGQIVAQRTQIEMKSLPRASYFVKVVNQDSKEVKIFKIIKN
jgi:hypothetical protein